jgi:hypothetical protein
MKSPLPLVVGSLAAITAFAGCTAILGDFSTGDLGLDASGGPGPDATQDTSPSESGGGDRTSPDARPVSEGGRDGDTGEGGPTDGAPETGHAGCDAGQLVCNDTCVADDIPNCGTCGNHCGTLPHVSGATTCVSGKCTFKPTSCAAGFADCDGDPSNGCEADLSQSAHCGACTTTCSGAASFCVPGGGDAGTFSCAASCPTATPTACGSSCVNTATDPRNCMTCGSACAAVTNGQPACVSSMCDITCDANFHKCGSACADNTSLDSCGTSCSPCPAPPANGTEACNGVSCAFTCNTNYTACGNICSQLSSDSAHCGSCSKQCVSVACTSGQCVEKDGQTVAFTGATLCEANGIFATRVYVPNALTVTALGSIVATAVPTFTFLMGLYNDTGTQTQPGTLLAQSSLGVMSPVGSKELLVPATPISPGYYWVAVNTSNLTPNPPYWAWGYASSGGSYFYVAYSYTGSMPATMPSGITSGTYMNFYLVGYQ